MTRKINKKVIVAIFMAVVMTVSLVSTASAYGSGSGKLETCANSNGGTYSYSWSPNNFNAVAQINPGGATTSVSIEAAITLSNGQVVNRTATGDLSASINYTPPASTQIQSAIMIFHCCNCGRTIIVIIR